MGNLERSFKLIADTFNVNTSETVHDVHIVTTK